MKVITHDIEKYNFILVALVASLESVRLIQR